MALWFCVAFGGAMGALCRFAMGRALAQYNLFPNLPNILATFCANIIGCFVAGILIGMLNIFLIKKQLLPAQHAQYYALGMTGFCGGLTTFSSFILEITRFAQINKASFSGVIFLYVILSLICGILALICGEKLGALLEKIL